MSTATRSAICWESNFNAADELPPDASGLGFDNIADLLSVSPLMLEKYLNAAESILDGAFPSETSARDFVVEGSSLSRQR